MEANLRLLAAYAAVARAGSFTAAAAETHASQSSLSRAVAELERYLLGESGVVAVATLPSVAAVLLPQVISGFRLRRPGVALRIMDGLEQVVLGRVLSGDADFAISTVGTAPEPLEHRPLIKDRFHAVLPEGHPLAERAEVTWEELAREPFLAVGPQSSVRRLTDAAFAQAGAVVSLAAEAGSVATVGGLVTAGLGVSAMPALVLPLMGVGPLVHRPLAEPVVDRRLDVVVRARRTLPLATSAFLELLDGFRREHRDLPEGVAWSRD